MAETPPENPHAFPNIGNSTWNLQPAEGMSLRDWFAGQALAATLEQAFKLETAIGKQSPLSWATNIAYRTADNMLAERAK